MFPVDPLVDAGWTPTPFAPFGCVVPAANSSEGVPLGVAGVKVRVDVTVVTTGLGVSCISASGEVTIGGPTTSSTLGEFVADRKYSAILSR